MTSLAAGFVATVFVSNSSCWVGIFLISEYGTFSLSAYTELDYTRCNSRAPCANAANFAVLVRILMAVPCAAPSAKLRFFNTSHSLLLPCGLDSMQVIKKMVSAGGI